MYLLLFRSVLYQGNVQGKGMTFESAIVFVHRMGMAFKVRHGLCIKKGHGLYSQAWSLHRERAWLISSGMVLVHYSVPHSYVLFFHCLGSHHDYWLSGIVCTFIVTFFFSWGIVTLVKMKSYAIFIFSSV